jgi:dTDP-D-glucose 4,6-dehydratase
MILITGGAGFIGGNFVHHWFERCARLGLPEEPVVVFDKLTYAGNPHTIGEHLQAGRATLVQADIADREAVRQALATHRPRAILHFAAESHVDRSIHGPGEFIQTNMVGTFSLLEEARAYWSSLEGATKRPSASCTSPPTRSMARSARPIRLHRNHPTRPTARIRPARPPATTWCAPTTTPTACRC